MVDASFESYWESEWSRMDVPFLLREAMHHLARKTWSAAIESSMAKKSDKPADTLEQGCFSVETS
jgi:hypothetical protein